ncbi:hypothetical protein ACFQGT_09620 [Natrialbaceae archaeon GCM10025810]|uniref:hypothetical protein n=1 Tax=Halovalidus salilacus TaxID=3075124 RepID=UPI00360D36C9
MANKNQVRVTVNLVDNFSTTLERLDKQLDKIGKKVISPEFKIKGTSDVDRLKLSMESIDDVIETLLKVFGERELDEALAKKKALGGTESIRVVVHDKQLDRAARKLKNLREQNFGVRGSAASSSFLQSIHESTQRAREYEGAGPRSARDYDLGDTSAIAAAARERERQRARNRSPLFDSMMPQSVLDGFITSRNRRRRYEAVDNTLASFNDIGGAAKRWLIPKGQMAQDLFAFLMPFMATFYTALAGAVASIGATIGAGAGIGIFGLLGFGENPADSLHLAQVRLRLFGRELFNVFKPVSRTFAPFMDEFLKRAPHALGALTEGFQRLAVYIPALKSHGQGVVNWVNDLLTKMVELQPQISQITARFGGLMGTKALDFFEWLVEELYDNQEAILSVLSVGKSLLILIYRIFMLWAFLFSVLQPVADLLSRIAEIFTNKWVAGITATIITMTGFLYVLAQTIKALAIMKAMGVGSAIAALIGPLASAAGAMYAYAAAVIAASKAKALLLGLVTLGGAALAVGAGIAAANAIDSAAPDTGGAGGSSYGGYGGYGGGYGSYGSGAGAAGGTTINVYGSYDRETQNRLKDDFPGLYRQERGIEENTEMPK